MNKREGNKELNRIKAIIRDRKKWRDQRVKDAKKKTEENKKKFEQEKKDRAKQAERDEHDRIRDEAKKKADETIRDAASQLRDPGTEITSGVEEDDPDDLGVAPLPEDDEPQGEEPDEEREASPEEVFARTPSKSRRGAIDRPEGITSPIRRRSVRGLGGPGAVAVGADLAKVLTNTNRQMRLLDVKLDALENTWNNRHDVSNG